MFLATTADQRFWDKEEDILFLGEWCKLYNQKDVWSKLNYEVLPYHWDDRTILYNDFLYLDNIYENYLGSLAKNLNKIHNTDHSLDYWRIVIGPWLYYFIEILYDRYLSIKTASDSGLVSNTFLCDINPDIWVPDNFDHFEEWFCSDEYNYYLYCRVIEILDEFPYEKSDVRLQPPDVNLNFEKKNKIKNIFRSINDIYYHLIPEKYRQIVFVNPYFNNCDIIKLQVSLGQFPYFCFCKNINNGSVSVDMESRKRIKLNTGNSEFELLLEDLIPEQIPRVFIEKYKCLQEKALDQYPKNPRVIFTANAFFDIGFCLWAAYYKEKGAKFLGTQHGGHYGSGLWSASENHQIKICDRYYSWGWKKEGFKNIVPMFSTKIAGINRDIRPDNAGQILWIFTSAPRYSYWMFSASTGPHMTNYIQDQFSFYNSISEQVKKIINIRFYPIDFGWNEKNRWKDEYPDLTFPPENKSMLEQLKESRLAICTYNATTYLETFNADIPTIVFWDPYFWELRPSARKYFDKLRDVGIFHETPESAAKMVNNIYKDPASWWNKSEVQDAKDEFCYTFARSSEEWLKTWKEELEKVLGGSID